MPAQECHRSVVKYNLPGEKLAERTYASLPTLLQVIALTKLGHLRGLGWGGGVLGKVEQDYGQGSGIRNLDQALVPEPSPF